MRTIFVGDTHGCAAELQDMLTAVAYDRTEDRLLLTGDAFARGPDPIGIWRLIQATDAKMVLGNHDAGLLDRLEESAAGRQPKLKKADQRYTFTQLESAHSEILAWLRQVPLLSRPKTFFLYTPVSIPKRGWLALAVKNSLPSAPGRPAKSTPDPAGTTPTNLFTP